MSSGDIDAYIAGFEGEIRDRLLTIRAILTDVVPGAEEKISYGIPTFAVAGKNVVHFGGFKAHVSVYPVPSGGPEFDAEAASYRAGRGTLKFDLRRPLPTSLIRTQAELLLQRSQSS